MRYDMPAADEKLGEERVEFIKTFRKSATDTILRMLRQSQSGHPGGSLSMLDILAVLYAFRISRTGEKIVVSNGHISPGVYAVLVEMGVVDKQEVVDTFRQIGSVYEGHVTRHIPGIWYGTGPLAVGISTAVGMAIAAQRKGESGKVWCTMGDGEAEEGQVHEAVLCAAKEKLSNLVVWCDWNRVQLTGSLETTMPIDVKAMFGGQGWNVLEVDGHDAEAIWGAINEVEKATMPTLVLAKTIMGKGVSLMEPDGQNLKSTWHGKAPKPEEIDTVLGDFVLTDEEQAALDSFRADRKFSPPEPEFHADLKKMEVNTGSPKLYAADVLTDCRGAYGAALLDLAKQNENVWAMTADLGGSVMTKFVEQELPAQHVEFGIAEQNMVSAAGGLSLSQVVPFCSTFGVFLTSRAKDQARVNDINRDNVKMVATHCGLSVGEDGPTHQAIDDMGSMQGLLHMHVCEPADPNHCDRMIRYAAGVWGNFYIRMGRAKLAVLTREDGSVLFDENYVYEYGKMEVLRSGGAVTLVASGPMVAEALVAREASGVDAEIVIASSPKQFDDVLRKSIEKTGKVITVEDHNPYNGLAASVSKFCAQEGIALQKFVPLGVTEYQLSGKPAELYAKAGIGAGAIAKVLGSL